MVRGMVGTGQGPSAFGRPAKLAASTLAWMLWACGAKIDIVDAPATAGKSAAGVIPTGSGGATSSSAKPGSLVSTGGAPISMQGGNAGALTAGADERGGEAGGCTDTGCNTCPAGFYARVLEPLRCVPKVVQISLNGSYGCALFGDASVKCWGQAGALGDGTPWENGIDDHAHDIGDDEVPSMVEPLSLSSSPDVKVVQVTAGVFSACAVLSDGSLKCWGDGSWGVLGRGDRLGAYLAKTVEPISVSTDPNEKVVQVAVGQSFACALLSTKKVKCWGTNQNGELGRPGQPPDSQLPSEMEPVSVSSDPGVSVVQLSAANFHVCALLTSGAVKCWGENYAGQLGIGDRQAIGDDELPSSVPDVRVSDDPNLTAIQVVTSQVHTCALLSDATVRCWGSPDALGYPPATFVDPPPTPAMQPPVQIAPPSTFVTSLSAGIFFTCATLSDGTARCWGQDYYGQLGYGNTEQIDDNETPESAGPIAITSSDQLKVLSLAAGDGHTCAVLSDGSAKCWGKNWHGQLGQGSRENIGDNELPLSVGPISFYE